LPFVAGLEVLAGHDLVVDHGKAARRAALLVEDDIGPAGKKAIVGVELEGRSTAQIRWRSSL
jgi:hypothetical protein